MTRCSVKKHRDNFTY